MRSGRFCKDRSTAAVMLHLQASQSLLEQLAQGVRTQIPIKLSTNSESRNHFHFRESVFVCWNTRNVELKGPYKSFGNILSTV